MSLLLAQKTDDFKQYLKMTGTNIVHPLGATVFVLNLLWVFLAPRKYVVWAVFFIACFISPAQRFAFLTLDFDFLRAITIAVLLRAMVFGELKGIRLRSIDYVIVAWCLVLVLTGTLRAGPARFINQMGQAVDGIGLYMIARVYIRNWEEFRSAIFGAALITIPVMVFFTIEKTTSRNYFSLLGGVAEFSQERQGRLRAQGAFTHPIIAGVYLATFAAMYVGVLLGSVRNLRALITGWLGTIAAVIAAIMTGSSTPIAGMLIALGGWVFYPWRASMQSIRWVLLFVLLGLHIVSQNGIHSLMFNKISFVSGSTGYHRFALIEGLLQNVPKWALWGDNSPRYNRSYRDITNDYVMNAISGGMVALALEITAITLAFYACGRALRATTSRDESLLAFGLGCGLLVITISALAVTMFGQAEVPFYMTLGMAASLGNLRRPKPGAVGPRRERSTRRNA